MENLPDDVSELKEIIRKIITQSQREIDFLKEQISLSGKAVSSLWYYPDQGNHVQLAD